MLKGSTLGVYTYNRWDNLRVKTRNWIAAIRECTVSPHMTFNMNMQHSTWILNSLLYQTSSSSFINSTLKSIKADQSAELTTFKDNEAHNVNEQRKQLIREKLNKCYREQMVFRQVLNMSTVGALVMVRGSLFKSLGAAVANHTMRIQRVLLLHVF